VEICRWSDPTDKWSIGRRNHSCVETINYYWTGTVQVSRIWATYQYTKPQPRSARESPNKPDVVVYIDVATAHAGSDDRSQALRALTGPANRRKLRVVFRKVNYRRPQAVVSTPPPTSPQLSSSDSTEPLKHAIVIRTIAPTDRAATRCEPNRGCVVGSREDAAATPPSPAGGPWIQRDNFSVFSAVGGRGSAKKGEKNWVSIEDVAAWAIPGQHCLSVVQLHWWRRRLLWRSFYWKIHRRRGHRKWRLHGGFALPGAKSSHLPKRHRRYCFCLRCNTRRTYTFVMREFSHL